MNVSIFVINLERNQERMDIFKEHMHSLGLNFELIKAVDGSIQEQIDNSFYDERINKLSYHKKLNNGEIACALSHRKAWAKLVEDKLSCALILEDDALLNNDIQSILNKVKGTCEYWDVIKLYGGKKSKKMTSNYVDLHKNYKLGYTSKVATSNLAQIISYSGAKKLLNISEKFGVPCDVMMKDTWNNGLRVLAIEPYPVKDAETISEINQISDRGEAEYSKLKKFKLKIGFELERIFNKPDLNLIEQLNNKIND